MSDHNPFNAWFAVRPMAPLFFGDTRPNQAGELHHAWSQFPPPIRAWQGLLRTHLLRAAQPPLDLNDPSRAARKQREALVGGPRQLPRGWQIRGAQPARLIEENQRHVWQPWLPMPILALRDSGNRLRYPRLLPDRQGGLPENRPLAGRPELDCRPVGGWCSATMLKRLLAGELEGAELDPSETASPYPPFVKEEIQSGLALDNRNGRSANTLHGMLYFQRQLRLEDDCGFLGALQAPLPNPIEPAALTRAQAAWGRKARPILIETTDQLAKDWRQLLDGKHLDHATQNMDTHKTPDARYWLITLTPTPIDNPAHPQPRLDAFPGVRFVCEAAIAGPPVTIGGFDMTRGAPLENRAMLPAGAAWLFRLEGGDGATRARALRALNNGFLLGHPQDAAFGYGHTLVGLHPFQTTGD